MFSMESNILKCSALLAKRKLKIAFAESATAGALSVSFALTPHSGKILLGSIVCYDADEKCNILNIPSSVIKRFTPESKEVTAQMAIQTKKMFTKADIIVAVTGLIKKGGSEKPEKPVGTMFIDFIFPAQHISKREFFQGNSKQIIDRTIGFIADFIIIEIEKSKGSINTASSFLK